MSKNFYLHEGDMVRFLDMKNETRTGELLVRPYGRRLHAIVRDSETNQVHFVPACDRIVERVV